MNVSRVALGTGGPAVGMTLEERVRYYRKVYRQQQNSTREVQAATFRSCVVGSPLYKKIQVGALLDEFRGQAFELVNLALTAPSHKVAKVNENIDIFIGLWKVFIFTDGQKIFAAREDLIRAESRVLKEHAANLEVARSPYLPASDGQRQAQEAVLEIFAKAFQKLAELCPAARRNMANSVEHATVSSLHSVLKYHLLNSEPNKHAEWVKEERLPQLIAISRKGQEFARAVRQMGEIMQVAPRDHEGYGPAQDLQRMILNTPTLRNEYKEAIARGRDSFGPGFLKSIADAFDDLCPLPTAPASRRSSFSLSHRQHHNYFGRA